MTTFLEFLKDFQTAIVGIIGFTGIISAQFLNASLARKQNDSENIRSQKAVAAALKAELRVFKRTFERLTSDPPTADSKDALFERHTRSISISLASQISELPAEVIEDVLVALAAIDETEGAISMLAMNSHSTFHVIEANAFDTAVREHTSALKRIEPAILALEKV